MTICSLFRALGGKVFPGKISSKFPDFIIFEEIIEKNGSERRFLLRISRKFPDFIVFEEIIGKNGSERRFLLRISSKFLDFIVFEEIIGKSAAKTLPREKHFPSKNLLPAAPGARRPQPRNKKEPLLPKRFSLIFPNCPKSNQPLLWPILFLNLSIRPPVSTSFCLPV